MPLCSITSSASRAGSGRTPANRRSASSYAQQVLDRYFIAHQRRDGRRRVGEPVGVPHRREHRRDSALEDDRPGGPVEVVKLETVECLSECIQRQLAQDGRRYWGDGVAELHNLLQVLRAVLLS